MPPRPKKTTPDAAPSVAPTQPAKDGRQYLQEFVAGGQWAALMAVKQALPRFIDDLTRDFGADLYDRMLTDDTVSSDYETYKLGVVADGVRWEAAVAMPGAWEKADPDKTARAQKAEEYRAFVEACTKDGAMEGLSLVDVVDDLLDGLAQGHRVAEIVLKPTLQDGAARLVVRALKPKENWATAFVVDEYRNVLGLIGADPKDGGNLQAGIMALGGDFDASKLYPLEKFLIFQHRMKGGDPRGTSVLRAAYLPWFLKTNVLPDFFKYLKQFASPGIIGKTPVEGGGMEPLTDADGKPVRDEEGNFELITAQEALYQAMLGWMNATVMAVKGGTEFQFLESQGDGQAFLNACDYFDRQITRAILGTDGMTMAAKHDSQGAKETGQDVVGLRIAFQKGRMASVLTGLGRLLVRVNFGDDETDLAPVAVLAKVEQQDFTKELDSVSKAYASGFIHESQLQALDARLGLPPRDMAAIAREKAEKKDMERLAAGDLRNATNPGLDPAPKGSGDPEEDA